MLATQFKTNLLLTLLIPLLAGCAATATPQMDATFGDAVNAAKAQQTMNPEASQNTEAVTGLSGEAANAAIDRYHKSFERPPTAGNVFNIGVGSGTGSTTSGSGSSSSGSVAR